MDNKQDEPGFDYKSRDWEKSMSKPVCVACLNESRAHQIPGEYEHICGKQSANNAPDTQLPAEVLKRERQLLNDQGVSIAYIEGFREGAMLTNTEYATKLNEARALIGKMNAKYGALHHESLANEIKTFLDGKK